MDKETRVEIFTELEDKGYADVSGLPKADQQRLKFYGDLMLSRTEGTVSLSKCELTGLTFLKTQHQKDYEDYKLALAMAQDEHVRYVLMKLWQAA